MTIPVYVATGFLDAGKTTFLNELLNKPDWQEVKILLIQFETGEEEFRSRYHNHSSIRFRKKSLEQNPEEIVGQIEASIINDEPDEIWIEWNGMVPFSALQSLLLQPTLRRLCKIQSVMHLADGAVVENLLGRTGSALPEQISNCDFVIVRNAQTTGFRRVRKLLRGINPGVKVCQYAEHKDLYRQLFGRKDRVANRLLLLAAAIIFLHLSAKPALEYFGIPANTIINVFLGIILQAVPFLLIGVLLSSAIQVFIPQQAIERWFPKSTGLGMLAAILGGFLLPVCDCASIPIFRSLVKKGVPLPAAVTFMTATPVINPVVILSTYYAFNGQMSIVLGRVGMGIIAAVITGLIFAFSPPKANVLSGGTLDRLMCSCGCYGGAEEVDSFGGKLSLFLRHSQSEFFSVGKYLVIGTLISSVFQAMGPGWFISAQSGSGLAVSILIMMAMAFVLSLCSSSDAVVARSFASQFPMGAIMGFLVFGPMMDIKNVMMLSSGFSKRFIGRLLLTSLIVCFGVVFLLTGLVGGR